MKYDFTSIIERKGMDALAVDDIPYDKSIIKDGYDIIPMWVADMNFATAPSVREAMIQRIGHPTFGYFTPREEYYDSIINWQKVRHGVTGLSKENIEYQNGVLGGVISTMNALCSRGDKVLIHTPAYIGFTNVLTENGYNIVHSSLIKDEKNIWRMDFADMEEKIRKEHIHVLIFCSPHNPSGRVWEKWEIEKLMELCRKYEVYVIADEIWSDIILTGNKHIPTQSVSEDAKNRTVAFYATTKTFNLAGLVGSYSIIYNFYLRDRVMKEASLSCYNSVNVLSMYALIGAYKPQGQEWVDELCQVITENVDYACTFMEENFKGVNVSKPQGTYMLFMDCEKWCEEHGVTMDELLLRGAQVGVIWQDGRPFFGKNHIRLNLALPKVRVEEAMRRLKEYVFK